MFDHLRLMFLGRRPERDERGASAVEYALLIAAIAGVLVLLIYAFGGMLSNVFAGTCQSVATHSHTASSC